MWTLIGFLMFMTAGGVDIQTFEIAAYSTESACMKSGNLWAKQHVKKMIEADFTCEKQVNNKE